MSSDQINFSIGTNLDEVAKQLEVVVDSIQKLTKNFKNLSNQQNKDKSVEKTSEDYKDLNENIDEANKKLRENIKKNVESNEKLKQGEKDREAAKKSFAFIGDAVKKTTGFLQGLIPVSLGFSFGIGSAIKEAFDLSKTLNDQRNKMQYLSDSTGDASQAISSLYSIAGGSKVSRATAESIMKSLGDQGVSLGSTFTELGKKTADLAQATGIAGSEWGHFPGELSFG